MHASLSFSLCFILCSVHPVGGRGDMGKSKVEKPHRSSRNQEHFSNTKKSEADADTYNSRWRSTYDEKSRKGSNLPADTDSADKVLSVSSQ